MFKKTLLGLALASIARIASPAAASAAGRRVKSGKAHVTSDGYGGAIIVGFQKCQVKQSFKQNRRNEITASRKKRNKQF